MKKIIEKYGMLKCISTLMVILSFAFFIGAAFVDATMPDMILKVIGLVFYIVGGMIRAITSDDHRLAKSLLVFVSGAFILTWVFSSGYYQPQSPDFYESGMNRLGFADVGIAIYWAINFIIDKLIFLFCVTGLYGVLSHVSGYQRLVEGLAKKASNHPAITTVVTSLLLFAFTSLSSQTFIVLLFVPFFISVLLKMNLDKLTVFAITFGSVLVGVLGCTYGTDGLTSLNYYLDQAITVGLVYRFILAGVAIALYNFFLVMRVKKLVKETKKNTKNSTVEDDPFKVEGTKAKDSVVPAIIVLAIVAIVVIIGYINWEANFGITVFNKFHDWLTKLEASKDFFIFNYILGNEAKALGAIQYVFTIGGFLLFVSALIAFLYRMKVSEYLEAFYNGTKKMFKPVLYLVGVYVLFGVFYLTPVIPYIIQWIANMVQGFSPYLTALMAFISSAFHTDLGYTAYSLSGLITSVYADNIVVSHTILASVYGLAQLFMPTSALLVMGLSLMKVDYKDWLKDIWLYLVGMIVILLILFTVMTYV